MEKRQAVPFAMTLHVRDHCMCLHAQRAARALARRYDEVLRPVGLTSGQFSLLMSLNRPEPPPMGAVAQLLAMDHTTLTANLKPLERRGLLEVRPDAKDRRRRRLLLTPAGMDVLVEALPIWQREQRAVEALVEESSAETVRSDMRALSGLAIAAATPPSEAAR